MSVRCLCRAAPVLACFRRAPDAALINDRQGTKFTFDCPSDSFEIGVRLVAVKSFSRQD
jgi:hypothetical protein